MNLRIAWATRIAETHASYERILDTPPFERWERVRMPESRAEAQLICAIECALGGDWSLADAFLARTDQILTRILQDEICRAPRCAFAFPKNLATVLRTGELTRLLDGAEIASAPMREAAGYFFRVVRRDPDGLTDEVSEGWWVDHLRALALIPDFDALRRAAASPSPLRHHESHRLALEALATDSFTTQSLAGWLHRALAPTARLWGIDTARLEWLHHARPALASSAQSLRAAIPAILDAV